MNQDLYIQLLNKEDDAQREVIEEYRNLIYTTCYDILKDDILSQDMVILTFSKAFNNMDKFDGNNLKAWLCQIAKNNCLTEMNRAKKLHFENNNDEELFVDMNEDKQDLSQEELISICKMSGCNELEIEIIVDVIINRLKNREISDKLNKPLGTVLSSYNRGIKKIKAYREKESDNHEN